ncbi:transposase family protein [Streptomyces sp. ALI-76-A]|nr:transposase family protein [Streptomyces sp. ALI-76-A]MDL5206625.1 transposase family protein [Streptomyces sp. ALI-76-A]
MPEPCPEAGRQAGRGGGPDRRHPHPHQTPNREADRRNYSGKHRSHGLHFLALTDENGRLIWISAARPGRTHDNTAARHDRILAHLRAAGLGALADLGFRGLDNDIRDPVIVAGYAARRYTERFRQIPPRTPTPQYVRHSREHRPLVHAERSRHLAVEPRTTAVAGRPAPRAHQPDASTDQPSRPPSCRSDLKSRGADLYALAEAADLAACSIFA